MTRRPLVTHPPATRTERALWASASPVVILVSALLGLIDAARQSRRTRRAAR